MKEDVKEKIAKSLEYHRRMNNTPLPKIEGDKAICPCCGAEVKISEEVMFSNPPVYTYYCTECLYYKEHKTYKPFINNV